MEKCLSYVSRKKIAERIILRTSLDGSTEMSHRMSAELKLTFHDRGGNHVKFDEWNLTLGLQDDLDF